MASNVILSAMTQIRQNIIQSPEELFMRTWIGRYIAIRSRVWFGSSEFVNTVQSHWNPSDFTP